jgi:Asp-tRNA(Asn)/Glu-tRNA(Gln) amidotransferase A subunit family amidase
MVRANAPAKPTPRWTGARSGGPLHGVPFTLKDVHDVAGMRSTGGTAKLIDRVAEQDSPVAARLKAAGAILLGKSNLELHADNPFERARNPWDTSRTPAHPATRPSSFSL